MACSIFLLVALSEPEKTGKRKRKGNIKEVEELNEGNSANVMWDGQYLSKDENGKVEENSPQVKTLLKTKYNKHVETAWRCILGND